MTTNLWGAPKERQPSSKRRKFNPFHLHTVPLGGVLLVPWLGVRMFSVDAPVLNPRVAKKFWSTTPQTPSHLPNCCVWGVGHTIVLGERALRILGVEYTTHQMYTYLLGVSEHVKARFVGSHELGFCVVEVVRQQRSLECWRAWRRYPRNDG
jgi:hypothetical protein